MIDYRLYFLSAEGGHIEHFAAIEADGPFAAIETAKLYRGRYALELWCRDQKVVSFSRVRNSAAKQPN